MQIGLIVSLKFFLHWHLSTSTQTGEPCVNIEINVEFSGGFVCQNGGTNQNGAPIVSCNKCINGTICQLSSSFYHIKYMTAVKFLVKCLIVNTHYMTPCLTKTSSVRQYIDEYYELGVGRDRSSNVIEIRSQYCLISSLIVFR